MSLVASDEVLVDRDDRLEGLAHADQEPDDEREGLVVRERAAGEEEERAEDRRTARPSVFSRR